jgi:hypothetical protein
MLPIAKATAIVRQMKVRPIRLRSARKKKVRLTRFRVAGKRKVRLTRFRVAGKRKVRLTRFRVAGNWRVNSFSGWVFGYERGLDKVISFISTKKCCKIIHYQG